MKLQDNPILPSSPNDPLALFRQLQAELRKTNQQVNALAQGRASANYNASSVAPADGTGNPGDFVAKLNPVATGPEGSQTVLIGWRCVSTGSSTKWMEVIEQVRPPPPTVAPTPAPTSAPASPTPPPAYSQKIQSEDATLHGIGVVTTIPGYEGVGHADWFRSGYDEWLEFSFTGVPTGGASGTLTFSYAGFGTADQTVTVSVNGAAGTMIHVPGTNMVWTNYVMTGVSFNAGTNTVRLTPEWSGYTYFDWAKFDQLAGAPTPAPSPPSPAPSPSSPAPAPAPAPGSAPYYPFGSRLDGAYPYGIKPNGVHTNASMDAAVKACYDQWKYARLAKSPTFTATSGIFNGQTITDGYHVAWGNSDAACVSEGIGYGMLITVLMAGYDANAKTFFDGLFRVARGRNAYAMPTTYGANTYMMEWRLLPNMDSGGDGYAANDGDQDIALALLMAHRQWGSSGTYNYYQEAINTINAIKIALASNGVQRGPQNVSRTSDYMPQHYRAFKAATNDTIWDDARVNSLALTQTVTANYSPSAHLQPGFILDPLGTNPRPDTVARVDHSGIEDIYDGNAVRNPWRWATDYVFSGDTGWGNLTNDIVTTLKASSGGSASGFSYAYNLDGTPRSGLYHEGTTAGCTMAGCMVNSAHQTFLNTLFTGNTGSGFITSYYNSELMLLPLILASGNFWRP